MKANNPQKNPERRVQKVKQSLRPGNLQPDEQTEILKACRKLSNILDPEELYAVFADVIKKKVGIRQLAIFHYRKSADALEGGFSELYQETERSLVFKRSLASWERPGESHSGIGSLSIWPHIFRSIFTWRLNREQYRHIMR